LKAEAYSISGLFGFFFSAGTVFFSRNISARTVFFSQFQPRFSKPNGAKNMVLGQDASLPLGQTKGKSRLAHVKGYAIFYFAASVVSLSRY